MIDLGQIKHMGVEDPAEGEVLMYDSGSGKFRNIAPEETAPGRKLWENRDIADRLGGSGYEYVSNKYYINANNNWATSSYRHWIIPLSSIRKVTIVPNAEKASVVAFLKTYTAGSPPTSAFSDKDGYSGRFVIETGSETTFAVPPDADYLYVYAGTSSSHASKPAHVYMTGIGVTEHTGDGSGFVKDDGTVDHATYLTQQDISGKANTDDLATVAFSGDYNNLANKPAVGRVVRVCSLQGANIVESGICPSRNDGDIYIITFESANIPDTWYVCNPQSYPSFVAEEYVSPNVPTSNFQQGDTCVFIAKHVTTTNAFGLTSQYLELDLLYNDRLTNNAVTIYSGSSAPSSSVGRDGDIYIQTVS